MIAYEHNFELNLGTWKLRTIVFEHFSLDGGAMFGQVPKTLWSKVIEPDEKNRIPLCSRLLEIQTDDKKILVEAGCGRKWSEKLRSIYDIEHQFDEPLSEVVSKPDAVILTHLHFDHAAGLVREGGGLEFPDAEHVISKLNYETALASPLRERASYLKENLEPLSRAKLRLTEDGDELLPGISVHQVHGHTAGLQYVKISHAGKVVVFPADLVPTSHHVDSLWVMGYDCHAAKSVAEKESFLSQAVQENWLVVYGHDRKIAASNISRNEKGKFVVGS